MRMTGSHGNGGKHFAPLLLAAICMIAVGCAPTKPRPPRTDLAYGGRADSRRRAKISPHAARAARDALVQEAIAKRLREHGSAEPQLAPEPSQIAAEHARVDHFIRHYSEDDRWVVPQSLERGRPYLPMIRTTLEAAGVPREVAYLPVVESRFTSFARSGAGAAGLWQFMRSTGRRYGLRVDSCVDERLDPVLSTRAAARYLARLYDHFNDWHLALAAYNAGEGRIARLMRKHDAEDYWELVDRGLLPRETADFVPKLIAVATIAKDPKQHRIARVELPANEETTRWPVQAPISLKTVAKLAGVDREAIEQLNPSLRCGRVPRGGYAVRLPRQQVAAFESAYTSLDPQTLVYGDGVHRVQRGESPASIARLYGISVRELMRENDIRNPRRLRVNTRLRIPDPI